MHWSYVFLAQTHRFEVILLKTSGAASEENFIKIMTFPFRCGDANFSRPADHVFVHDIAIQEM